ncbi:heme exporter protein A [Oxalobacteraceae bacterium GrIS 2.11]
MTLQAQQLACTRGERVLFDALELELHRGDALRIAGNNGAGKTSLLRILSGLSTPNHGSVTWGGADIYGMRELYHRQITYLGHLNGIKDDFTACENVLMACKLAGMRIERKAVLSVLEQIGLGGQARLPTRVLSQGQKKRVALARLPFCSATPIWILDEPFVALDPDALQLLTTTINQHLENHGMVVYTTHQDVSLAAARNLTINLAASC